MSFYSPIDRLAQTLPRPKGTGAEFMTELSKMPGYKSQEAEDRGLQALMNLPKMERAQFMEALRKKQPVVPEVKTLRTNDEKRYGPRRYDQEEEEQMPRHESFTLPGGSNYREILLKHPQGEFKGVPQHFGGEPNILASVRAKDRLGPNGEKILHIEELQSDWHQQGRDKGYTPPDVAKQIKDAERAHRGLKQQLEEAKNESGRLEQYLKDPSSTWQNPAAQERVKNGLVEANNKIMELMPQVMKAEALHQDLLHKSNTTAPDAPFKKNWHEMALKKMIHHAAKNGYDAIAITPGAEQADRYGLAKHIGSMAYLPDSQQFYAFTPNGDMAMREENAPPERVSQLIGKELTQKLLKSANVSGVHTLAGDDIKIGGEGMKGFYDKIVPNFLNQFGKKYGAKVGTKPLAIEGGIEPGWVTKPAAPREVPVHHFPITPAMREDVVKNGVPLYAEGGVVHMAGGSIKELENYIRQSKGEYGAKRVQRAADEIPNLERMYTPQALQNAFGGDNAKALMTMNPADFEKFAVRLFSDPDTREEDMAEKIERDQNLPPMSHHDYIKYLASIKGGFADAPFLEINKRLGYLPNISGHEGRHRSRALASMNAPKSLVRLLPSSSMREDMPRRRQEEFIEAMKKELGEKRLVTGQGRSLLPADLEAPEHKNIERRNMLGGRPQLPDIYAEGGSISRKEHDANLAKFLKKSKVKYRLYHGTTAHDDYADAPGQAFQQFTGQPTWLAKEPYTASGYAKGTGSVYPVYAQVKRPMTIGFDANDDASKAFSLAKRLGVDVDHMINMHKPQRAWEVVNNPAFVEAAMNAGHDSFLINEGGYPTYGVFDPSKIKSAIGNRGTYDPKDPDITKAKGGAVKPIGYTKEQVTVSPNLDAMRYELESVKHYTKKVK